MPFLDAMKRLTTSIDGQHNWVVAEFQVFEEHRGAFANIPLVMIANIPPQEWWDLVSKGGTHLAPLVKHMAQVCSSLLCKRNWSNYLFVQNKLRNWLSLARAKILYLYQCKVGARKGGL